MSLSVKAARNSDRYARLVRDADAGPEFPSDETDETSSAAKFKDVLPVQGTPPGDVAREHLDRERRSSSRQRHTYTEIRHGISQRKRRTSPAGQAIPPQPGDASTASLIAIGAPRSPGAGKASSMV